MISLSCAVGNELEKGHMPLKREVSIHFVLVASRSQRRQYSGAIVVSGLSPLAVGALIRSL